MKLLKYEWKKLCKRKIIWIFFIGLLLLNEGLFLKDYINKRYVNKDLYQIQRYYEKAFIGPVSSEKLEQISQLKNALASGTLKLCEFATDISGDYYALNKLSDSFDYLSSYQNETEKYQSFYEENERLMNAYLGRQTVWYDNFDGWEHLNNYQMSNVFILLLIFLALAPIWAGEREEDMLIILNTTKKGREQIHLAKLAFSILIAFMFTLLFAASELVTEALTFGLPSSQAASYSVPVFKMITANLTFIGMWLLMLLGKIIAFSFVSILVLLISGVFSNILLSVFTSAGVGAFLLFISESGLKIWNPLSLLYLNETLMDNRILSAFGKSFFPWELNLFISILLFLAGCLICVWRRQRI